MVKSNRLRWIVLGLALLGGGMFAFARSERAWQAMIVEGAALEKSIDNLDGTRPVLYGEGLDGFAHHDYDRAFFLLDANAHGDWLACRKAQLEGDVEASALRESLVQKHAGMLEALARGAHRTRSRRPVDWSAESPNAYQPLLASRAMVNVAVLSAELHLEKGRPGEAVDVLLDGMQYGRDVMHEPHISQMAIGSALLAVASKEALLDEQNPCGTILDRLPPEQLERLALGLERLDAGIDCGSIALQAEAALFIRKATQPWWSGSLSPFSDRSARLEIAMGRLSMVEFFDQSGELSWREFCGALTDYIDFQTSQGELLWAEHAGIYRSLENAARGTRTLLSLTRTAIDFRLTGEVVALADPFGGQLQIIDGNESLRVQSVGPDGDWAHGRYALSLAR